MREVNSDNAQHNGPIAWKVVDLVPRSMSESDRESRNQRPALERMRHVFDDLLTESKLFSGAPFDRLCLIIGIDAASPNEPRLNRISKKTKELTAILEFDWQEVRNWSADEWFQGLIPLVNETIAKAAKRYNLPIGPYETAFRLWTMSLAKESGD